MNTIGPVAAYLLGYNTWHKHHALTHSFTKNIEKKWFNHQEIKKLRIWVQGESPWRSWFKYINYKSSHHLNEWSINTVYIISYGVQKLNLKWYAWEGSRSQPISNGRVLLPSLATYGTVHSSSPLESGSRNQRTWRNSFPSPTLFPAVYCSAFQNRQANLQSFGQEEKELEKITTSFIKTPEQNTEKERKKGQRRKPLRDTSKIMIFCQSDHQNFKRVVICIIVLWKYDFSGLEGKSINTRVETSEIQALKRILQNINSFFKYFHLSINSGFRMLSYNS